jgi:hypothetical protein
MGITQGDVVKDEESAFFLNGEGLMMVSYEEGHKFG